MATPLKGTEKAALAIKRVRYSHDALIDQIIAHPMATQKSLGELFGYAESWISRITCSDAFQARLAERKEELVDPSLRLTLDDKFRALATKSLDVVTEKLFRTESTDLAMKALELSTKALGLGARSANVNVQTSFVVALPGKNASAGEWAAAHGPQPQGEVIEGETA